MQKKINNTFLSLKLGDITKETADAIVNAANHTLLGGGGVDGAIHKAGGTQILNECIEIRKRQGGCKTGDAVITTAGRLNARFVIHTVGPKWQGGSFNEDELLASAYKTSLRLAYDNKVETIAFPSISTGAYKFPVARAAEIALKTAAGFLQEYDFKEVRFVLFTDEVLEEYYRTIAGLKD
ncbi:MAG: O-acetyl-ADP-ribose deacetylase [Planctomycetes bacterium]|nr:O-acetyl-ADP-ribose deacetylase [Planctomycetota bacterium]